MAFSSLRAALGSLARRLERLAMGRKAYKWVLRDWLALHDLPAAANVLATMRFTRQIEPQALEGPRGRNILVVAPHPDDEVIGPGGTLIRMARRGAKITVLFVTSGKPSEAATREAEARAACVRCGFDARFSGEAEGAIQLQQTSEAIAALARELNAETLFIPFLLDDHDDHRRVNEALLNDAAVDVPLGGMEVWAYQVYTPLPGNVAVDVTDVAEEKAKAIRGYASQMRRRDWAHFALGLNAFNCRLLAGGGGARYVESFFVVPLADYVGLCRQYFGAGGAYYERTYAVRA